MKTLPYTEFRTKRQEWVTNYEERNSWAKGIEDNFEKSTRFAYKLYLTGKVPAWAK